MNGRTSKYVKGMRYTVSDNAVDNDLRVKAKKWLAEGKAQIWAPESPPPTITATMKVN